jgi:hypothetical protein
MGWRSHGYHPRVLESQADSTNGVSLHSGFCGLEDGACLTDPIVVGRVDGAGGALTRFDAAGMLLDTLGNDD